MLLSTGEQISMRPAAPWPLSSMGYPGDLPDRLAGGLPDRQQLQQRPHQEDQHRAHPERAGPEASIVIVAGFQGINKYGDITTLGRGGSDTICRGAGGGAEGRPVPDLHRRGRRLHRRPPLRARTPESWRRSPSTRCWSWPAWALRSSTTVPWSWPRSISVNLEVLLQLSRENPARKSRRLQSKWKRSMISGVAKDKNVARLALVGVADQPRHRL